MKTKEDLLEDIKHKREELQKAEGQVDRAMKGESVDLRPGCSVRQLDKDVLKLRRELNTLEGKLAGRKR